MAATRGAEPVDEVARGDKKLRSEDSMKPKPEGGHNGKIAGTRIADRLMLVAAFAQYATVAEEPTEGHA